jgi:hypothetical protein
MSNEAERRTGGLSRRVLLQSAAAAVGGAAVVAARSISAPAAIKISKTAVAYQDHPQDDKSCGKCRQFQAPDGCKIVDGPISPQGFCRIFTPLQQTARPVGAASAVG